MSPGGEGGRGGGGGRVSPRKLTGSVGAGALTPQGAGGGGGGGGGGVEYARLRRILTNQRVEVEFFRQPDRERQPALLVLDSGRGLEKVGIRRLAGKFLLLDVEAYFAHDCYTRGSGEIFYTALLGRG